MIPSLDLLPAGCLVTSLARDVRFANAFFRSDLGLDPAELTGRPLDALLTPASRIFYESYLHPMLLTEGLCTEASITFISGQGERVPVVVNARLLPGPDPMVIWCITRAENRDKIYEDLRQALSAQVFASAAMAVQKALQKARLAKALSCWQASGFATRSARWQLARHPPDRPGRPQRPQKSRR